MEIKLEQKIKLDSNILIQEIDDEAVFLDCKQEEYYGLNNVGTRMLRLLQESESIKDAYKQLLAEYEVEPEELLKDLFFLIEKLLKEGLIEIVG